jgi:hypothetical protein
MSDSVYKSMTTRKENDLCYALIVCLPFCCWWR